ncbi:MAG: hypothetical protein KAS32_09370 [Candidatus Peribacteraceae bacterium]|nr:hypothetical protein [Candidatus Peribacteraceae bacterium]
MTDVTLPPPKRKIILNRIQTPDGTVLESHTTHDYVIHTDKISGEIYMVDGGKEYLRRNTNKIPYIEQTVYYDDEHQIVREHFVWGTYGKTGNQAITTIRLKEMSNNHINNILLDAVAGSRYQEHICKVFVDEVDYRKENNIEVKDD